MKQLILFRIPKIITIFAITNKQSRKNGTEEIESDAFSTAVRVKTRTLPKCFKAR